MTVPEKTKPQGAEPGVSESALPGRRSNSKPRAGRHPRAQCPPLGSFHDELERLRGLLAAPHRGLYLARYRTLEAQRWMSTERVLKAALRENRSPEIVAEMVVEMSAAGLPPFDFGSMEASWVLDAVYADARRDKAVKLPAPGDL